MKRLITFLAAICFVGVLFGQSNTFKYEIRATGGLRVGGSVFAKIDSITLQAGKLRIMSGATLQKIAGHVLYTDTITMLTKYARKASPTFSGIAKLNTDTLATQAYARASGGSGEAIDTTHLSSRIDLKLNVSDTTGMLAPYALLTEVGEGASMVYPGAGIPLSTGSAWGTSITNNSANWNTAYGWGNHALGGYVTGTPWTSMGYVTGTPWTSMGYLTSQTSHADVVVDGDFTSQGIILRGASSGTYSILTNNSANWNTAYGWGDHSGLYLPVAGTAASVTGFTPASGSLTLSGADALTINTTAATNVTFPTSGTLATTQNINDSILSGVQIRTLDSDTIPLFVFGLGSGHSSDTAIFNNGRLAGAFYNSGSDTLYVTELRGVLVEGTGTETIAVQVSWDVNMKDATPTNLNTTALSVISMTTGTVDTTFDNNGIPPGVWVWCTLSGASANNKPTMLTLTMTGYRRNRSY